MTERIPAGPGDRLPAAVTGPYVAALGVRLMVSRAAPAATHPPVVGGAARVAAKIAVAGSDPADTIVLAGRDALVSVLPVGQCGLAAQRPGRYVAGSRAHPDRAAPDLARQLILDYTAPDGLVLDPFATGGTGTASPLRRRPARQRPSRSLRFTRTSPAVVERHEHGHSLVRHSDVMVFAAHQNYSRFGGPG